MADGEPSTPMTAFLQKASSQTAMALGVPSAQNRAAYGSVLPVAMTPVSMTDSALADEPVAVAPVILSVLVVSGLILGLPLTSLLLVIVLITGCGPP